MRISFLHSPESEKEGQVTNKREKNKQRLGEEIGKNRRAQKNAKVKKKKKDREEKEEEISHSSEARGAPAEPSSLLLLLLSSAASLAASTTGAHLSTGEHLSGSSLTALASSATAALAFPRWSSRSAHACASGAVAAGGPPRLRERPAWRTATAAEGWGRRPLPPPLFSSSLLFLLLRLPLLVARFSAWAQLTQAFEFSGCRQTTRSKTAKARS
jgi:hypothetical protein